VDLALQGLLTQRLYRRLHHCFETFHYVFLHLRKARYFWLEDLTEAFVIEYFFLLLLNFYQLRIGHHRTSFIVRDAQRLRLLFNGSKLLMCIGSDASAQVS